MPTTLPLVPVPDPEDGSALQCFVDVVVEADGARDEQRWLLDTGADRSGVVATDALAGLARVPAGAGRGLSGAAAAEEAVRLDAISAGGVVLARDVEAGIVAPGAPGLLGADVLAGHRVHLCFSRRALELDGEPPSGGFLLELERPGHAPFVEVRGPGLHTRACLDTGAGVTVVDRSFADAHPDVFTLDEAAADGTDAAGNPVAAVAGTMAGVRIGGTAFDPTPVVAVDLSELNATLDWPLTVILGLPLVATADWWLDFGGNAWSVTRGAR